MLKHIIFDKLNWEDFHLIPEVQNQIQLSNIVTIREANEYKLSFSRLPYIDGKLASDSACNMCEEWSSEHFCQLFVLIIFI